MEYSSGAASEYLPMGGAEEEKAPLVPGIAKVYSRVGLVLTGPGNLE